MWTKVLSVVAACGLCVAYNPGVPVVNTFNCDDLFPLFSVPEGKTPQILPSPFKIKVANYSYVPAQEITVNLTASPGRYFRSFIIQARTTSSGKFHSYVGSFSQPLGDKITTRRDCRYHALTSASIDPKQHVRLVWRAPDDYRGNVEFRATFVEDSDTFWVAEKSKPIYDIKTSPPIAVEPPVVLIPPIETHNCGETKGCYREPEDCQEYACLFVVTWRIHNYQDMEFEIGAQTDNLDDRYVALALSNDTYMGDDAVFECVHNSLTHKTEVYESRNLPDTKENKRYLHSQANINFQEGSHFNGRLRCRFRRKINPASGDIGISNTGLSGRSWHMLVARGTAGGGKIHRHGLGVGEFPAASPDQLNLQQKPNVDGRARYPLVKAHGCFMLFAWIFCATIGLILTKYYKRMWPNNDLFGQRYWFVGHVNLMVLCFFAVVIGFILIFIEAQGYSQAPDLPQRAHPILGIIIFVCVVINPMIALIRPSVESKWRPCFNWIHFVFGFIANVLSIPNIFIGMDFGKMNVPWWATWILVFYVIFHIVVEITLEIHQCCMWKKDKKRRQKYEMQKSETGKFIPEPLPAGARFKKNMLFLHITVTTIITIIMIIIFAVC